MAFLFKSVTGGKGRSKKNGYAPEAGVGIVFKSGPDQALYVKSLADGGPASQSDPPIRVNDCLQKVDGENVYRMPIEKVVEYILGERGSTIVMTFERFAGNKTITFTTTMKRGDAAKISSSKVVQPAPTKHAEIPEFSADDNAEADPNATMRRGLTLHEKHAAQQSRLSERLEKLEEMRNIVALSFTGASTVQDAAGIFEGDVTNVSPARPSTARATCPPSMAAAAVALDHEALAETRRCTGRGWRNLPVLLHPETARKSAGRDSRGNPCSRGGRAPLPSPPDGLSSSAGQEARAWHHEVPDG